MQQCGSHNWRMIFLPICRDTSNLTQAAGSHVWNDHTCFLMYWWLVGGLHMPVGMKPNSCQKLSQSFHFRASMGPRRVNCLFFHRPSSQELQVILIAWSIRDPGEIHQVVTAIFWQMQLFKPMVDQTILFAVGSHVPVIPVLFLERLIEEEENTYQLRRKHGDWAFTPT